MDRYGGVQAGRVGQVICRSGFSRDVGAGLVPALFVCVGMIAAEAAPTGEILNTLGEILNTLDYYIMQSERGETQIMILTS